VFGKTQKNTQKNWFQELERVRTNHEYHTRTSAWEGRGKPARALRETGPGEEDGVMSGVARRGVRCWVCSAAENECVTGRDGTVWRSSSFHKNESHEWIKI